MTKRKGAIRARKSEDKSARREHILDQSWKLFETRDFDAISMEDLARQSGLAKGTLYLYFQSKEEVFIHLVPQTLNNWLQEVGNEMKTCPTPASPQDIALVLSSTLRNHPALPRLLSDLHTILEKNSSLEMVHDLKIKLLESLQQMAQSLEGKIPALEADLAFPFLMKAYALIVGLHQVCNPPARVHELLQKPELEVFKLNFHQELETGLVWLLSGIEKMHSEKNRTYHLFNNY